MKHGQSFYRRWYNKAVGVVLLIAVAPLLLIVAVRAAEEMAQAVIELLGPIVPYAVAILVLVGVYRLVLGRRT